MTPVQTAVAWSVGLFLGMLVCLEIGYRIGSYGVARYQDLEHEGTGTIEAAVFALLGLLLAFTFGGAMSRLESRRALIVQEANAIGTAYLRLDILPAAEQPGMRHLFREYLDARLSGYEKLVQRDAANQDFARAATIQQQIWSRAVAAGQNDSTQNTVRVLLPALNEMIDVTTARAIALDTAFAGTDFCVADQRGAVERVAGGACDGQAETSERVAYDFVCGDYFDHDLCGFGFGRAAFGIDTARSRGSGVD